MAEDVVALLDHLDIRTADLLGYSMGARICAFAVLRQPSRARSLILGGLGVRLVNGVGLPENIAEALEVQALDQVTDPSGRMFRNFAEQTGGDRKALAACIRGSRQTLTATEVASIHVPVLIAVGSKDLIAGSASELAAFIPGAQTLEITGRDHMLSVGDKIFKQGVLRFLQSRP
jgi:pimeloyl-ACP methyl ester carboxylesterase